MNSNLKTPPSPTLAGHPAGLFTLFFAEMWERFSYYGMRALLVFYMIKGFMKYGDPEAYAVYGAYTALVYMTPFFGGMLADRLLGARRAVILGGLLMAAGHLMMTMENHLAFLTQEHCPPSKGRPSQKYEQKSYTLRTSKTQLPFQHPLPAHQDRAQANKVNPSGP